VAEPRLQGTPHDYVAAGTVRNLSGAVRGEADFASGCTSESILFLEPINPLFRFGAFSEREPMHRASQH
jgi:hypothetical protein